MSYVLAIDQGTTSTRAILFSSELTIVAAAQQEFTQHYPAPGCVEHDPEDLWRSTLATGREALAKAGVRAAEVAAIGLTNQRETTLIWDRKTGARSIARSSGRIAAPPTSASGCARQGMSR